MDVVQKGGFAPDSQTGGPDALGIHVESHPVRPAYGRREHAHTRDSLFLVVAGRGYARIEDQQYPLEPRMALFLPAGTRHALRDRPRSAMTVYAIGLGRSAVRRRAALVASLRATPVPVGLSLPLWRTLQATLRWMLHEQTLRPTGFVWALDSGLSAVLVHLARAYAQRGQGEGPETRTSVERVRRVLDYVADSYYQPHSLPEAARLADLSQRHFSTLCRQVAGRSFVDYVNGVRVRQARRLLEDETQSVAAVAFQVGFEELSTFYRAFRKHAGRRPRRDRAGDGARRSGYHGGPDDRTGSVTAKEQEVSW